MIKFEGGETKVVSRTPRKAQLIGMNRQQRRAQVYRPGLQPLLIRIRALRKDMKGAGIKLPPICNRRNRKVLSGYMSQLMALAFKEV